MEANCDIQSKRIGMIAGWGDFPVLVAKSLCEQGYEVYCLGVVGHTDPDLRKYCAEFKILGMGRFGTAARFFRRHQVQYGTMAGKIHKHLLLQPNINLLLKLLPDLTTIRMFVPHFLFRTQDNKDDSLLLTVVRFFAKHGVEMGPATDHAPELLVKEGLLTKRAPTASQWHDIEFGWKMAKEMGRLDIGQSVVVKNRATIAVEAIEGTDQCIRRAATLCKSGGFTVVKVAKPNQDMRFDVPTIGVGTLQTILEAGGRTLAIEADKTIVLDRQAVIDYADQNKMTIIAVDQSDFEEPAE